MSGEKPYNPNDAAPGIGESSAAASASGTVERKPVVSSSLSSVGYNHGNGDLHIEFKSGKVVIYSAVPRHIHRNLMASPSLGRFHAQYIAKTYSFTNVSR